MRLTRSRRGFALGLAMVGMVVIAALIAIATVRLLRDATDVLLEGAPRRLDLDAVARTLADAAGVESVHHLHVWQLGGDSLALSAHLVMDGAPTLHDAQQRVDSVKGVLARRFGIDHATIEVECHDCNDASHR